MKRFYVTFERPEYFEVAIDAETEDQAISIAEDTLGQAIKSRDSDRYFTATGDIEFQDCEGPSDIG